MAEKVIPKRVFFPKGEQSVFIKDVQKKLSASSKEIAELIGKSARTLADWEKEKFSMSHDAVAVLSKKSGIAFPAVAEIKDAYWYASAGASLGGLAVYKKYGNIGGSPEERKRKWHLWWDTKGKFQKHPILNVTKPIKEPKFSTVLAEFTGIILGDGGISKRQVVVTLHRHDDKEYSDYVRQLVKKLFCVTPGIYRNKKSLADDIVISRTALVQFCVNKIGLKIGNKVRQQVEVPLWIKNRKSYSIACLRGLVDTDGCIIKHRYTSKGKKYCYKKLSFTNSLLPMLQFVFEVLSNLGMNPRVTKNGKEVRIESKSDMERYFHIVGTNNPKHLYRWLN